MESFFLGGRNMHWLLAGVSMVATTFAADTPLAVAEIVSGDGISGNWLWWNFLAGGMLTTFFFARLWQRSGVLTEVELIELRYAGKPAQFLRGFKAIYLGVLMNVIVIAWVNVALQSLLVVFFGLSETTALLYTGGAMILAATYASFSGLIGVAVTDAIQFVVAMIGCVALAYFVVNAPEIGGIAGLKEQLENQNPNILNFLPSIGTTETAGTTLGLTFVGFLA
jgi:Na+/proline symporter